MLQKNKLCKHVLRSELAKYVEPSPKLLKKENSKPDADEIKPEFLFFYKLPVSPLKN